LEISFAVFSQSRDLAGTKRRNFSKRTKIPGKYAPKILKITLKSCQLRKKSRDQGVI